MVGPALEVAEAYPGNPLQLKQVWFRGNAKGNDHPKNGCISWIEKRWKLGTVPLAR